MTHMLCLSEIPCCAAPEQIRRRTVKKNRKKGEGRHGRTGGKKGNKKGRIGEEGRHKGEGGEVG